MAKLNTGSAIMEVDIHNMTVEQAKIFLKSKLKGSSGVYRIRVIHGYHGGTALRDLVRRQIAKDPKVIRTEIGINPGETDLILKEF